MNCAGDLAIVDDAPRHRLGETLIELGARRLRSIRTNEGGDTIDEDLFAWHGRLVAVGSGMRDGLYLLISEEGAAVPDGRAGALSSDDGWQGAHTLVYPPPRDKTVASVANYLKQFPKDTEDSVRFKQELLRELDRRFAPE